MKRVFFCFGLILLPCLMQAQTSFVSIKEDVQELKTYALLDLGFNAKLLHLNTDGAKTLVKKEAIKKSSRTLEEILGKSKKENTTAKYHLIAGCFSSMNNAGRLVADLNKQGYPSKIIGKNEKGLYMVTYQTFSSQVKALKKLNDLHLEGKSTWVRKQ